MASRRYHYRSFPNLMEAAIPLTAGCGFASAALPFNRLQGSPSDAIAFGILAISALAIGVRHLLCYLYEAVVVHEDRVEQIGIYGKTVSECSFIGMRKPEDYRLLPYPAVKVQSPTGEIRFSIRIIDMEELLKTLEEVSSKKFQDGLVA